MRVGMTSTNIKSYCFNTQFRPYSLGTIQRGLTQYKKNLNEKYVLKEEGAVQNDWWTDIQPILSPTAMERFGYPTQKPLGLYERIIKASSNEGDVVLDPFAGCATTLVAAERLKRQWVGIDIWEKAHEAVVQRLQKEGLAPPDGSIGEALPFYGEIHYAKEPPERHRRRRHGGTVSTGEEKNQGTRSQEDESGGNVRTLAGPAWDEMPRLRPEVRR